MARRPNTLPQNGVQEFDVWIEGFIKEGQTRDKARFLGSYTAASFEDAIRMACKHHQYNTKFLDLERMTFWGCKLFDNAEDAKRIFG